MKLLSCILFPTVPSGSLMVKTKVLESDTVEAGGVGPTLTCTVTETISGLTNSPSAVWVAEYGPLESVGGIAVNEIIRNDTTAVTTLSFLELHTSHAGLYTCQGILNSPAADGGTIDVTTPAVPVTVKCEWGINSFLSHTLLEPS